MLAVFGLDRRRGLGALFVGLTFVLFFPVKNLVEALFLFEVVLVHCVEFGLGAVVKFVRYGPGLVFRAVVRKIWGFGGLVGLGLQFCSFERLMFIKPRFELLFLERFSDWCADRELWVEFLRRGIVSYFLLGFTTLTAHGISESRLRMFVG